MLFMETLNTNSIKDKNRMNYERSAHRQDHGTRGNVRDRDPWGEYDYDHRGFKNVEKRIHISEIDDGLEDYLSGMTPEELEVETSKLFDSVDDKNAKESVADLNLELPAEERDFTNYEELMSIGIDPDELSRRALHVRKLRDRKHIDDNE